MHSKVATLQRNFGCQWAMQGGLHSWITQHHEDRLLVFTRFYIFCWIKRAWKIGCPSTLCSNDLHFQGMCFVFPLTCYDPLCFIICRVIYFAWTKCIKNIASSTGVFKFSPQDPQQVVFLEYHVGFLIPKHWFKAPFRYEGNPENYYTGII